MNTYSNEVGNLYVTDQEWTLKDLLEYITMIVKSAFTGKLTINFHNGGIGKIEVAKTIKSEDLKKLASEHKSDAFKP